MKTAIYSMEMASVMAVLMMLVRREVVVDWSRRVEKGCRLCAPVVTSTLGLSLHHCHSSIVYEGTRITPIVSLPLYLLSCIR